MPSESRSTTGDRPLVLVDVGCRWGVADEWLARGGPDLRLYAFDADPEECRRLQADAPPNVTYVPHALADARGTRTLHIAAEPGCSSLFPPDPEALATFPDLHGMTQVGSTAIPVRTLDDWAVEAGVAAVDVLKLDVQGSELDVLRGAERLLAGVRVIEAEVMFNPLYRGQPLFGDIDAFLRARGFRLWRLAHLVHYSSSDHAAVSERTDRQYFDSHPVAFPSGAGQLSWGHAYYCCDAMLHPRGRAPQELALDRAAARLLGLDELAGAAATRPPAPADFSGVEERRIALTTSCRDTDDLPKVPGAGGLREQDGTTVQVMHNGVVVEEGCYHGRWMTEVIHRLRGHHEPQEERAFHALVRRLGDDTPAPVMIELGSFWAYYSLWLGREIPGTRSVLVEPDPHNLAVGLRNFALNRMDAESVQAAVGLPDGAEADIACESDGQTRRLPLVTVDGLMERLSLPRIDLLLCDTQGAELAAIEGAAGALADGRLRFMVISTHHHSITGDALTHQRCLEALGRHGAQIIVEHTVHESASGDGLIVASADPRDVGFTLEVSRTRGSETLFGPLEPELAAALEELRLARAELEALRDATPRGA